MTHFRTANGILVAALLAAPASATTWVVDDNGGPGIDFVNVQSAVDAAVDGDVIEVRDGAYPPFTIDGKALVVIADVDTGLGESARVSAMVRVANVPAGKAVELDGLEIGAPWTSSYQLPAAFLEDNAGSVRLVDCVVNDSTAPCVFGYSFCGDGALRAEQSAEVVLSRCTLTGGDGAPDYTCSGSDLGCPSGIGVSLIDSHAELLACTAVGGTETCDFLSAGFGGNAVYLQGSSTLFVDGSLLRGGDAINTCPGTCGCGPDGFALRALPGTSATWKDTTFDGAIEGDVSAVAIAPYCIGTYEECPCGNRGAGSAGCEHSLGLGGARLAGVGNASVAADTVLLQVTGLNPTGSPTALLFQGTTRSDGTPFGDGLLCAGGTISRLKAKAASGGTVAYGTGQPGDPALSIAGLIPPAGGTRSYQVWYRNTPVGFCTPAPFNLSNGVEIAWGP